MLLFNLINTEQKQVIYAKYGLDWEWVRDAVRETFSDEDRRAQLKESTNIFRVLIKTLLHAGIITQRTAPLYAVWVDMDELKAEGDGIPGDIVAEEMLVVLREINAKRRRIGAKDVVASRNRQPIRGAASDGPSFTASDAASPLATAGLSLRLLRQHEGREAGQAVDGKKRQLGGAERRVSRPLVSAPCFLRLLLGSASPRVARRTAAARGKTRPK